MKKVALITGGSRGIGYGIAQSLAKEGWSLAINGMRPASNVSEVLDTLKTVDNEVIYCRGHIGDKAERQTIMSTNSLAFWELKCLSQ